MGQDTYPEWRRAATHTLHTAFLLKAILEQRLQAGAGILLADNEALLNIAHAEAPLRMSDIADRLVLSRGGTTKVIDRLEEMGLVERHPDEDDRRATVVEITEAGLRVMARAREIVDAALAETWAAHVDHTEAGVITEVMDRVMRANHPGSR
jgi:DNA-binding MarR family transcriptional regulator